MRPVEIHIFIDVLIVLAFIRRMHILHKSTFSKYNGRIERLAVGLQKFGLRQGGIMCPVQYHIFVDGRNVKIFASFFQVDANTGQQYTFSEYIDRIQRCAAGLQKLGFSQGDVLCAITFNTIEYHIIWYALVLLGGTLQTASPLYTDGKSVIKTSLIITV